jgi:hypothetical protein
MVENEPIGYEEAFVRGSQGIVTLSREDVSKPVIFRGITKRKHINRAREANRDFYYMDTGYFGNFPSIGNPSGKKTWHRVVKNELQHTTSIDVPSDRWDQLVANDPKLKWTGWKTKGNKILLVIPNAKACHFFGFDLDQWKTQTIQTIKQHTDMPIVIRTKGSRSDRNQNSIYAALDNNIFATVTFNSIAAMESIAYGIPAFISVPCAASPLANTDLSKIRTPIYPNEELVQKHCRTLAYGQFSYTEILNGTAWNIIQRYYK